MHGYGDFCTVKFGTAKIALCATQLSPRYTYQGLAYLPKKPSY